MLAGPLLQLAILISEVVPSAVSKRMVGSPNDARDAVSSA